MGDVSKGLQWLPHAVAAALSTLGAGVAVKIGLDPYDSEFTHPFLCKKIYLKLYCHSGTTAENIIVGCAPGDADAGEIGQALEETTTVNPFEASFKGVQSRKSLVFWKTLRVAGLVASEGNNIIDAEIDLGKGIPLNEDIGIQLFAYNPGASALTTGSVVRGIACLQGVWLNG